MANGIQPGKHHDLDKIDGYPLVNIKKNGKSPCSMGKSTISMVIFNSYVKLPEINNQKDEDNERSIGSHSLSL
jgi:hypothetical protein